MTDIEHRLRAAMHAAMDREEAVAEQVLRGVYRRHRRHTLLVAGLAVLIAVAAGVPAAIATRSFSGTHAPATPQTPAPATPSVPKQPLPTKMTGLPMPAGTNLELLDQGVWYSTASHRATAITGLPSEPYAFRRVPGGWSVTLLLGGWGCPPHCWLGQYFLADGSTHATHIGTGFRLAAADRPGEVWLQSYARPMVSMTKASASAQLFSTTGQALGPLYRLPAGYLIVRGIGTYLLLSQGGARFTGNMQPYAAVLWDPRSRRVVDRLPGVVDAGPDAIAWSPQCSGCHVRLLNELTGKSVTTPIPGGQPAGLSGSFTDDGTLLAVQLPDGYLAVYNISSRSLTVIPGTALNNNDWQVFGWLNGSHTLVVTAGCGRDCTTVQEGSDQLAYWQPGDTQLRVTTVTNQDETGVLQGWAS
jgi:hypothetical protein